MAYTLKNFDYHEWLVKTNFSFLMGGSHPHEILKTAIALGYSSLCVNDFDGQYGLARTFNELQHLQKSTPQKLKLNFACELHLTPDHHKPLLNHQTLALVAETWQGYKNLNQIISQAQKKGKGQAFLSMEDLCQQNLTDMFAIVPMRNLEYQTPAIKNFSILKDSLHNRLYFAVTKTFNTYSDRHIPQALSTAKILDCPTLFSQDVFYHHRNLKGFHDLLCAIRTNQTVEQAAPHFFPNGERSFHLKSHIWNTYKSLPDFQKNLRTMAELNERCTFSLSEIRYEYPKEMIPPQHTPQSYLEEITWQAAKARYTDGLIPPEIVTILSKELDLIEDLRFADYFLTVWDIVAWARKQQILCQGRGSAANSAVCYMLGITSCNPSHFELLFERFISKERGDPPDIDVDFEHERREEVLQYIYTRYGRKKAAMVANVITFRNKGALRAVGKAFGVDEQKLARLSKLTSTVLSRKKSLKDVLQMFQKQTQSKATAPGVSEPPWALWQDFSERLKGFPRHLGLHSGGFIISQHDMDCLVPQEPATMEGRTVIQWCKDDIEELGFFKIDCLSLGMLTALRKCFQTIESHYGKALSLHTIPHDDTPTYQMIQKADTVGVFQIESRAQMSMLPRLKPKCFYDLVIEIAIIRPGPIQGKVIHPYLRRRNGQEPIHYPDPRIQAVLAKTLGVVIFQEQAMRIAMALGDFTPGEANELRKHIGSWGSKDFSRNLNPYLEKLLRGLKQKGIDPNFTDQLLEQMKGFSSYGFPESHAISFAFIAYASCYLKCHYPAAFFLSVLNSQPMGFYTPHALLQAAQRQNVKVLPISVNASDWDHKLEALEQKPNRPTIYGIRLGFRIVKNLSAQGIAELVRVRDAQGPWRSFEEFISTTSIYRDDYTAIAAANGFFDLGLERFEALWKAEAIPYRSLVDVEERKVQWNEKNEFTKAQMDFAAFGTNLQVHPVEIIKTKYWPYALPVQSLATAKQLEKTKGHQQVNVFGMLLAKQAPPSAKGMVFFTLEDETGFINLVFTPQVYQRFHQKAESSGLLCVQGRLQKVDTYHSILVHNVLSEDKSKILDISKKAAHHGGKAHTLNIKPRNYY